MIQTVTFQTLVVRWKNLISDSSVDESDYEQVDANTAIGRDNCTVCHNECPRIRRNVHQNVPHERAGVHVAVPTHSVCYISFFFHG